jgi:hypothetical protein
MSWRERPIRSVCRRFEVLYDVELVVGGVVVAVREILGAPRIVIGILAMLPEISL